MEVLSAYVRMNLLKIVLETALVSSIYCICTWSLISIKNVMACGSVQLINILLSMYRVYSRMLAMRFI